MGSLYLSNLNEQQRNDLQKRLWDSQTGNCFICGNKMDLQLQAGSLDVDHVEPLKVGGKDEESNFALTHAQCNRSKQASDLRVARLLAKFEKIRERVSPENRGPNLGDVLAEYKGARFSLPTRVEGQQINFSFSELGRNEISSIPLYTDDLSGLKYFFLKVPIEYLWHDDRINPRAIGGNLNGLITEFHRKIPQLQIGLGWLHIGQEEGGRSKIHVFDGQHKTTAQILLGVREIPLRIFVNPDIDILLTANTHAGTTLKQLAFDKSVQRHLGSSLFTDRVGRFRKERGLREDEEGFSEAELVSHFKGEWREMKRYILDAVRDSITHSPENKLKEFVDFAGKGKEKPISYSTIEKTFYSFFIYQDTLETPLNYKADEGENPRDLEKRQILELMNIIAEEIYLEKYNPAIGTNRIESQIQKNEIIPEPHLAAFRLSREEILYTWLSQIGQIIRNYFITTGKPVKEDKIFQYKFPEPLWDNLRRYISNLSKMPLWVNHDLSLSVFGGKQNYDYWQTIFETGRTPQGQQVMPSGINLIEMIREK